MVRHCTGHGFRAGPPQGGGRSNRADRSQGALRRRGALHRHTAYDRAPDSVSAQLARRDRPASSDKFTVYIDVCRDRRTGFFFGVKAAGTHSSMAYSRYPATLGSEIFQTSTRCL
jgi:hypothetical protein